MARRQSKYTLAISCATAICCLTGACQGVSQDRSIATRDTGSALDSSASPVQINDRGYREYVLDDGLVFVQIPAGSFSMGSAGGEYKERPIHDVYLNQYDIGKYPITVAQFAIFVDSSGYISDAERGEGCWIEADGIIRYDVSWRKPNFEQKPDHPVVCVSWNDAIAYADWVSQRNAVNASLPTEAQWEKAARGDDQRTWPWGNQPPNGSRANFADKNYLSLFGKGRRVADRLIDDGYAQTSPVDAYPQGQSPYGVYDMAGNVIDWNYDWFDASYYSVSPSDNPTGPSRNPVRRKHEIPGGWGDNLQRSIRGGAWTDASGVLSLEESGHSIRSDMRERTDQYSSDDHLGFRLVIDDIDRSPPYKPAIEQAVPLATSGAAVTESIGNAAVTIEYDRLAVNGREGRIFGESIPFGEVWAPGDNIATQIHSTHALQIHEETLPAGTYTLYLIPEEIPLDGGQWTIIFNQNHERAPREYLPVHDVLRVRTRAQIEDNSKERMEFFFDKTKSGVKILRLLYEFVEVHIPFERPGEKTNEVARAAVMNAIGTTRIRVDYSRGVSNGRKVFGDLIPFNERWFGSANDAAIVSFSENVQIAGERVAAGTYKLAITPRENTPWSISLISSSGEGKDRSGEIVAHQQLVDVDLADSGPNRLEYYFDYIGENERQLVMVWGGATISILIAAGQPAATDGGL